MAQALERNIHVLCEVTAAVTVDECRAIVEAASSSAAHYAMAENFMYARYALVVAKLIEDGRFGEPHYAEGEYLMHGRVSSTAWRRKWMVGRKGITCENLSFHAFPSTRPRSLAAVVARRILFNRPRTQTTPTHLLRLSLSL